MKHPFFSIIIPTRNRNEQLAVCLQAVASLDYPRDRFEVIVVDDGSDKSPEAVVDSLSDQLDVTLLTQSNAGPAVARNTGVMKARGKYLAFTDDDCSPAPNWLNTLAARLTQLPNCIIGGQTLNSLPDNIYSTASQMLIDYLYTYYNSDPEQSSFLTSNNLALSAESFRKIGGFDATFHLNAAEDRELCDRWLFHGFRMVYAPEVLVHHAHPLTYRTFWRQHFYYGIGAFQFHKIRARRNRTSIKIEPLSFYLKMLLFPWSTAHRREGFRIAGLLIITQVVHAAGFLWKSLNPAARCCRHIRTS